MTAGPTAVQTAPTRSSETSQIPHHIAKLPK